MTTDQPVGMEHSARDLHANRIPHGGAAVPTRERVSVRACLLRFIDVSMRDSVGRDANRPMEISIRLLGDCGRALRLGRRQRASSDTHPRLPLVLKDTWTKGGKAREIPIRTTEQREVLDRAHRMAGRGSLIPADRNYVQQLRVYEGHTARAGLSKLHGLRHAYAQQRYQELTGWKCSAAGGTESGALTPEEKAQDKEARLTISRELGHEKEGVTAIYLGR